MAFVFHGDFDVRADGGTFRFHAGKPHGNPVIIVAGISENEESVGITGRGTARIEKDILMAIISEVGEGDSIFLRGCEATRWEPLRRIRDRQSLRKCPGIRRYRRRQSWRPWVGRSCRAPPLW